uniref:Uncharacterized protein n=1 Tax=Arundo donax TaxID=35708 RepID=A0A0A9U0A1_ARUDO
MDRALGRAEGDREGEAAVPVVALWFWGGRDGSVCYLEQRERS